MVLAAGVEDMDNSKIKKKKIADKTNWNNSARYLKLNLGVDDPGVNLLRKVYNSI